MSLLPTKLGRSISDGFDNLLGSERPASLLKNPKKDDSVQPDSVVPPPPPHLTRQMSEHHISVFKSGLRQLMYVFIVGATVRLVHAWYTYFESSGVFPASGVLEYLKVHHLCSVICGMHSSLLVGANFRSVCLLSGSKPITVPCRYSRLSVLCLDRPALLPVLERSERPA